jgi:hypothetical protein
MSTEIALTTTLALPFLSNSPAEGGDAGVATTTQEEPTVYRIPEVNYASLQARFNRLQRRAAKLESGDISMTEVGREDYPGFYVRGDSEDLDRLVFLKPDTDPIAKFGASGYRSAGYSCRMYLVTVSGVSPRLNGWQFIGAIDVMSDEENNFVGNLLRSIPGVEMPERFRTERMHCDHCNLWKNWKSTFIVRHDDGTHKQVGRQCLKDFTGHKSPEMLVRLAELLMNVGKLFSDAEDDEWEGGSYHGKRYYNVEEILRHVACLVRIDGWKSKAFDIGSTASTLTSWVLATGSSREEMDRVYVISEADKVTAGQTLDWMADLALSDRLNDYEHNLYLLSQVGSVEHKRFGLLASAIPAFMRAHEREVMTKREQAVSQYVGEIGKRTKMTLALAKTAPFDSSFGTRTMCKYLDEQGNVVVWWASGSVDMAVGTKIKVKATVKKHEEYNGVKQSTVSHLAVTEVLLQPARVTA